ncbi:hypothetical protein [Thauera butanivorans]|uniref:hypothetical protein n=1 Tax=Thauera butanivorans TaxID=86174 RepID=UPI000837E77D|nr:hypothetical protein [Thauera butanivorans]
MSRRQPDLTINGLRLPLRIGGEIQQSYEDIGGFTLLRLGAGAAVPQQSWRKLRTTLSAQGIAPPGLAAVDWTQPVTLGCIAARSIQSASNIINIPAGRRTDAPPYGWAVMPDGLLRPTAVAVAGNVATLTAIAGAAGYQVLWYPLLSVYAIAGVQASYDAAGAVAGWELVAEEV